MTEFEEFDALPPERPGRLGDPSVYRSVHGAYHALGQRLHVETRQHGLGVSEALVLASLLRHHGCAAAVLRHELGLHRSTLSSLLDRLESKGMICRSRGSFDGRRLEIDLTAAGKTAGAIAAHAIREVEAELDDFTSAAQRRGAEAVFAASIAINRPGGILDV